MKSCRAFVQEGIKLQDALAAQRACAGGLALEHGNVPAPCNTVKEVKP